MGVGGGGLRRRRGRGGGGGGGTGVNCSSLSAVELYPCREPVALVATLQGD